MQFPCALKLVQVFGAHVAACERITYGSEVVSSGLISLGSMFCEAQTTPIADRESSDRR